ncbi:unnamed protein product [Cuscuta epithymum]|uniref:Uncharacterized protein n=1 Tax=Cuscuta epithymum TaxID=186058 RepID=A0AAV0G280_9ASTE|nr:unnamed protein product [Cuscuta epithymum]
MEERKMRRAAKLLSREDLLNMDYLSNLENEKDNRDISLLNEDVQVGAIAIKDKKDYILEKYNADYVIGTINVEIPLQAFFHYQDNVILEGESHFECGDTSDSSGDDLDRELLNHLSDSNWKTRSQLRRNAHIQEKMESLLD